VFTPFLQKRLPLRDKMPLINRVLALAFAWFVGNGVAVAGATAASVWLGSLFTGVPLWPLPVILVS